MKTPRHRTLRAGLAAGAGLAAVAVLGGVAYEQIGRYRAARDFPPPGKMVDVGGGRRIQLDCRGAGSPTVVFEAGLSVDGSLSWSAVQPKVAAHTRACAYSRAGLMWSDLSNAPPGAAQAVRDLRTALANAGERGPFVLVGQSLGGLYSVGFTRDFGAEVAGLVLVDPSHPEQVELVASFMTETRSMRSRIGVALAPFGVLRAAAPALLQQAPHRTAHEMQAIRAYASKSLRTQLAESDATNASLAEAKAFRDLGDRPLVVLTAMAPFTAAELRGMKITPEQGRQVQAIWKHMHEEMAAWSSRGRHLLVADAGHDIQLDQPQVVVDAVLSVVEAVRKDRR
ncbi:alpha/beta hydrolase family protein [Variovorax paradoxus B4]|uniref:Alpha/beta hydrolase family protein n=1 Tax=Variovorax paradoxus B4 TaxID=1246301 RepID=T1XLX9_VARPD|nr:alpha/beta hydrolase [Variovorax paradoxus]AGU53309.1 alpha/beta hydrolase family protein [Variovorax paradoxus B4]